MLFSFYIIKKYLFSFLLLAYENDGIFYTSYPVRLNTYKGKRERKIIRQSYKWKEN